MLVASTFVRVCDAMILHVYTSIMVYIDAHELIKHASHFTRLIRECLCVSAFVCLLNSSTIYDVFQTLD